MGLHEMSWTSLAFWTSSPDDIQKLSVVVGGVIAALIAVWRVRAANKSAKASEMQASVATQAHIIQLLKDASLGLLDDNFGVRINAIITLGRIGRYYKEERTMVRKTLLQLLSSEYRRNRPVALKADSNTVINKGQNHALQTLIDALFVLETNSKKAYDIKNIDFSGCDFSGLYFSKINFRGCIFDGADFSEVRMHGVCFSRCSLVRCDFSNSLMFDSKIMSSSLSFSCFYKARMELLSLEKSWLVGANLSDIFIKGVKFTKAYFRECSFVNACVNEGFRTKDCFFDSCDFSGALFRQTSGLQKENIKNALCDRRTLLPISSGVRSDRENLLTRLANHMR